MKTKTLYAVIRLCVLVSAAIPLYLNAQQPPLAPKLRLTPTNELFLGNIRSYGITNLSFKIFNDVDAPLKIDKLRPTCPCIKGRVNAATVEPGTNTELTISLDATQVRNAFQRGLWISSNDPQRPNVSAMLAGHVVPAFEGMPPQMLAYMAPTVKTVITNVIKLVATEPGLTIGRPRLDVIGPATATLSVVTNAASPASYTLTSIFTPTADDRANITLEIPVLGNPNYEPLVAYFRLLTGVELTVIPRNVIIPAGATTQQFRLTIRNRGVKLAPDSITWEPRLEGLGIEIRAAPRGDNLLVTGNLSAAALQKLLESTPSAINFLCPGYKPATVTFSVAD